MYLAEQVNGDDEGKFSFSAFSDNISHVIFEHLLSNKSTLTQSSFLYLICVQH